MHRRHSLHRLRSLTGHFTLNKQRTLLYNLDKSDGICGGLLPSFDLSGVSRKTLALGLLPRAYPVVLTVTILVRAELATLATDEITEQNMSRVSQAYISCQ